MARATHVYNIAGYCMTRNSFLFQIYGKTQHLRGFLSNRRAGCGMLSGAIAHRVQ
jgi:hypothetical protein